jgi:hypothetical protein
MTTTVRKGGLRRVADAKRERAAQRMPNTIVETADVYGDWRLTELRAEAVRREVPEARTMGKQALQDALRLYDKAELERRANNQHTVLKKTGRLDRYEPVQKNAAKAPSSNGEATVPATKSEAKARVFCTAIEALGWVGHYRTEGELTEVVATRGADVIEAIHQAWDSGVYVNAGATYTVGDRTVQTRNVSAALKLAERKPTEAAEELARVATNKAFRRKDAEVMPKVVRLPFDPATAPERVVVDAIAGHVVKWHNRLSGGTETAKVGDPRTVRVTEQLGERVVLFCCQAGTGFRAFRLSALVAVGRGKAFTGGQQRLSETVLVDVE